MFEYAGLTLAPFSPRYVGLGNIWPEQWDLKVIIDGIRANEIGRRAAAELYKSGELLVIDEAGQTCFEHVDLFNEASSK